MLGTLFDFQCKLIVLGFAMEVSCMHWKTRDQNSNPFCIYLVSAKEVQIVYRLFLVNVPSESTACTQASFPASYQHQRLSDWKKNWLELAWQYIVMTRNNLSIIWISLVSAVWPNLHRKSVRLHIILLHFFNCCLCTQFKWFSHFFWCLQCCLKTFELGSIRPLTSAEFAFLFMVSNFYVL